MATIKYFKHKQCLISYSEYFNKNDLFNLFGIRKNVKIPMVYIDLIEVHKNFRQEGMGTETLKMFISQKKEEGFKSFLLIASYNPDYYKDSIKNEIDRLIQFYNKFDFKVIEDISSEEKIMLLN